MCMYLCRTNSREEKRRKKRKKRYRFGEGRREREYRTKRKKGANARKRQYSITSSPGPGRYGVSAEQTATCFLGSGHIALAAYGALWLSLSSSRPEERTKSWRGVSNLSHHFCFSLSGRGVGSGLLGSFLVPSNCSWSSASGGS